MEASDFARKVFSVVDSMDADGFVSFFAGDGIFRFGNAPGAKGKEEIKKSVGEFFTIIKGLKHELNNVWNVDGTIISEGSVVYTKKDGSEVSLPFATIFRMEKEMIKEYLVFADVGPLFQ